MPSYKLDLPAFTLPFPQPHANAHKSFDREVRYALAQPLKDRQAARDDYHGLLQDPDRFRDDIEHILAGDYGLHELHTVVGTAQNARMNHRAVVGMIAAIKHGCPATFARQAYNRLSDQEKKAVDNLIDRVIMERATEWSQQ